MPKTRLGISCGLLAATVYFVSLFSGYLGAAVLVGYILLFEGDMWLRHNAIKAFALMICFSLLGAFIGFVPSGLEILERLIRLLDGKFEYYEINSIVYLVSSILSVIEKILFIVLGIKAVNGKSVNIPFVDNLLAKYVN